MFHNQNRAWFATLLLHWALKTRHSSHYAVLLTPQEIEGPPVPPRAFSFGPGRAGSPACLLGQFLGDCWLEGSGSRALGEAPAFETFRVSERFRLGSWQQVARV